MNYTDADRQAFLKALDLADCEISDWEAEFLESNLDKTSFSEKQRAAIDAMIEKYGDAVKF